MANSRIFVRGLPPTLAEDEFRAHFSQVAQVTDAKFIPRRRIGYIGYKTEQDAARAVKYFNKSYIRTSKIGVELADNRIPTHQLNNLTSNHSVTSTQSHVLDEHSNNPLKRKRDGTDEPNDTKLDEYLELMKPYSQSNSLQPKPQNLVQKPTVVTQSSGDVSPSPPLPPQSLPTPESPVEPDTAASEKKDVQASSDADWMRSRTSRLLGLIDDEGQDEDEDAIGSNQPETVKDEQPPASPLDQKSQHRPSKSPPTEETLSDDTAAAIRSSRRLFLRNLSYDVKQLDLEEIFEQFGSLEEIHVPRDPNSGQAKGFAFIQYNNPDDAVKAYESRDGTTFEGRLLHILPAGAKRETHMDDYTLSKLPLKKQRQIRKKSDALSTTFSWNALFMNTNAVISSISDRLGVSKSEILDPASTDASVKLAQAETHVIQDTKTYFSKHGVNLDAFKSRERSDTAILVKNFAYGTSTSDLKHLFSVHGEVSKVLMPPSGTIAIVDFELPQQAKSAFHALAYSKFRDSVLFLEKAPGNLFKDKSVKVDVDSAASAPKPSTSELLQTDNQETSSETTTLYVRNLNFSTTNEALRTTFRTLEGFVSARVKTKSNPKNPSEPLSMGFGFVEFRSAANARAALAAMNGFDLDGHQLVVKISHKGYDAGQERKAQDATRKKQAKHSKLVIKNLPFEASKKDVRNLFKSYGQLQAVRVPKKFDNSRKGYAFAEFSNPTEAENALESLKNTHLLGRRLVIDYAAENLEDPEIEIAKMQQKVSKQTANLAIQRLASGSDRKKINIAGSVDENGG